MSRKANRLRNRIRINREQAGSRERAINRDMARLKAEAEKMARDLARERESLAKRLLIMVEREERYHEQYAVTVRFAPTAFVRALSYEPGPQNITAAAHRVGDDIGRMVARAIIEHVGTKVGT